MPQKPRKRPSGGKFKVIGRVGTPQHVVDLLDEARARAENDETLAVAVIEVQREGMVDAQWAGVDLGLRHQIIAGSVYLQLHLGKDE